MSYKTRISQTKEQRAEGQVALSVLEAKSSVEAVVAAEKLKVAKLEAAQNALLGAEPFNIESVLKVQSEIATAKARLEAANSILSTEFAD